jgi:hypothetical protein
VANATSLDAAAVAAPPAQQPAQTTPSVAPAPGPLPTIVPNRRRLDNRFPVLAFAIRTFGRPLFEVLLTTDRSYFDSANAAKRTPANFHAGRQDGGLIHSTMDETAYVVPAGVLKRFAEATPRPSEIFYAVAVYETPDGPPALSLPPQILATAAPSVLLSADFAAHTLAAVLSIPAEKLRSVSDVPSAYAAAAPGDPELDDDGIPAAHAVSWSSEDDDDDALAQAAEAWLADPQALALDGGEIPPDEPPPAITSAYDDDVDDALKLEAYNLEDDGYTSSNGGWAAQAYDDAFADEAQTFEDDLVGESEEADAFAYDDGYDDDPHAQEAAWAGAEESVFPAGMPEPAMLADADDQRLDEELADAAAYDEPYDEEQAFYEAYADAPAAAAPAPAPAPTPVATRELDIPGKIALVTKVARLFEPDGFRAVRADPRSGLCFGFVGFSQASGRLGRLLTLMRERDLGRFRELFGADADELLRITNQHGAATGGAAGRPARLQPVGGRELWAEPWISRFRAAGEYPPFQAAQNELAVRSYVDRMLRVAADLGLDTERALALLVDRAIQMGVAGAQRWLIAAVGPIKTDAQRQQALAALGVAGVREFQERSHIRADGNFGPATHAALVGALRRLGAASPVPIPTRDQVMDAIVARVAADQAPWRQRVEAIRTSRDFGDAPLAWPAPAARR